MLRIYTRDNFIEFSNDVVQPWHLFPPASQGPSPQQAQVVGPGGAQSLGLEEPTHLASSRGGVHGNAPMMDANGNEENPAKYLDSICIMLRIYTRDIFIEISNDVVQPNILIPCV